MTSIKPVDLLKPKCRVSIAGFSCAATNADVIAMTAGQSGGQDTYMDTWRGKIRPGNVLIDYRHAATLGARTLAGWSGSDTNDISDARVCLPDVGSQATSGSFRVLHAVKTKAWIARTRVFHGEGQVLFVRRWNRRGAERIEGPAGWATKVN